jgi:hypothetical protein
MIDERLYEALDDNQVWEVAGGVEYSTQDNQQYSLGLWSSFHQNDNSLIKSEPALSASWNKTYLNDDLILSALANHNPHQKIKSVTVLAQYKLDDYWQLDGAISSTEQDFALLSSDTDTISVNVSIQF